MSNINSLPTAVVTPLMSPEASKKNKLPSANTGDKISDHNLDSIQFNTCQNNTVKLSGNVQCTSSIASLKSICSSTSLHTDCTVELTKIQHPIYDDKNFNLIEDSHSINNTGYTFSKNKQRKSQSLPSSKRTKLLTLNLVRQNKKFLQEEATQLNMRTKQSSTKCSKGSSMLLKKSVAKRRKTTQDLCNSQLPTQETKVADNIGTYLPQLSDILQQISPNVQVCSLCHLPAHFLPGLGDLFGPYRPTYDELIERYKKVQDKFSWKQAVQTKCVDKDSNQEVCIDQVNKTCYISTSCFAKGSGSTDNLSSLSRSNNERIIHSLMPQLRLFQTVDCVLTESNRRPAAKFSRDSKSLRIPGFSGKITTRDKNRPAHCDSNKTLLHDMNTIVFVEPSRAFSTDHARQTSASKLHPRDETVIDLVHKLDVSPAWVHAPCAVWTPGVYSIRNQVYGLTTAISEASKSICSFCQRPGATIPVKFKKNKSYHYLCCIAEGLKLDEQCLMAS